MRHDFDEALLHDGLLANKTRGESHAAVNQPGASTDVDDESSSNEDDRARRPSSADGGSSETEVRQGEHSRRRLR
ncbi:hypothetical protein Scep_007389 [Stephania cephalantha]|uniref:Uncharacterized protein n=1 Tax=Stephania cephalantha TaxID=152367 RepID=A0AAP0K9Y7_9MAGN